jgi:formamidopyrimidine-DNA glycosylase
MIGASVRELPAAKPRYLLVGRYEYDRKIDAWRVAPTETNHALRDPYNRFIHVVWTLEKNKKPIQLVLCDSRKFAKVTLLDTITLHDDHFKNTGPEPLEKQFTEKNFRERIEKKPTGKIKTVLLDQSIIAGIGNIYSDEMLWLAGIHPERKVRDITQPEYTKMFKAMRVVLSKGIDFGGDSTSDYRNIYGEKGKFHATHNVYRETGKPCKKKGCLGIIHRKVVGARSAHFCPVHQK